MQAFPALAARFPPLRCIETTLRRLCEASTTGSPHLAIKAKNWLAYPLLRRGSRVSAEPKPQAAFRPRPHPNPPDP
jgi:hypothetical protein